MQYKVKCKGCGIFLNDDIDSLGYIPNNIDEKKRLCQRCFSIKNYNKLITTKNNSSILVDDVIKNIDFKKHQIFLIVDILDFKNSLIPEFKDMNVNIIFNKMDCLPLKYDVEVTEKNIMSLLEYYGFEYNKIFFVSALRKKNLNRVYEEIENITNIDKKKSIFVGKTNVGKSSLINSLLNKKIDLDITISPYLNTTLNINQIKYKRIYILDTPGITNPNSILNWISQKDINDVIYKKINKVRTYQVNHNQTLYVENFLKINLVTNDPFSISFYINDDLKIIKGKYNSETSLRPNNGTLINLVDDDLKSFKFKLNNEIKNNLVISNLGLLSIKKGIEDIEIITHKDVDISLLEYSII